MSDSLLKDLQERESRVIARIGPFATVTGVLAFCMFAGTILLDWLSAGAGTLPDSLAAFRNPSLAILMAGSLRLFANYVMWLFGIWSVAAVPYVAYVAHEASRAKKVNVETSSARWVRLWAATLLPAIAFSMVYGGGGVGGAGPALITSVFDLIVVAGGTLLTTALLALTSLVVPRSRTDLKLALFSSLLYLAMYLQYGQGFGLASQAALMGIMCFLLFGTKQVQDLLHGMATFDIEPSVVEQLDEVIRRRQEIKSSQDHLAVKRQGLELSKAQSAVDLEGQRLEHEQILSKQIGEIQRAKVDFSQSTNSALLEIFKQKLELFQETAKILQGELRTRIETESKRQIEELRSNASKIPPGELATRLRGIMDAVNNDFNGVPEALQELQTQMFEIADQMQERTRALQGPTE